MRAERASERKRKGRWLKRAALARGSKVCARERDLQDVADTVSSVIVAAFARHLTLADERLHLRLVNLSPVTLLPHKGGEPGREGRSRISTRPTRISTPALCLPARKRDVIANFARPAGGAAPAARTRATASVAGTLAPKHVGTALGTLPVASAPACESAVYVSVKEPCDTQKRSTNCSPRLLSGPKAKDESASPTPPAMSPSTGAKANQVLSLSSR